MAKIVGTSRVFKKLKMVSRQTDLEVRSAIQRNTDQILAEATKNVPIDTGDLQRSGTKDTTNPFIGKVAFGGTLAPYAPYVEFGTGSGVVVPEGFNAFAMQFYVNGKGTMRAQPYLIPAFILYKKIFLRDIRKIS